MKLNNYTRLIDVDYFVENKTGVRAHRMCQFRPLDGNDVREIVGAFERKDTARLKDNEMYKQIVTTLEKREGGIISVRKVVWAD